MMSSAEYQVAALGQFGTIYSKFDNIVPSRNQMKNDDCVFSE